MEDASKAKDVYESIAFMTEVLDGRQFGGPVSDELENLISALVNGDGSTIAGARRWLKERR